MPPNSGFMVALIQPPEARSSKASAKPSGSSTLPFAYFAPTRSPTSLQAATLPFETFRASSSTMPSCSRSTSW